MTRPTRLIAVVGTGTDIGKTWLTAELLAAAQQSGASVAVRKPVQSYAPDEHERTDAHVLGAACGTAPEEVCPVRRWMEVPMAPPMAAAVLGRPAPTLVELAGELVWGDGVDIGFVEMVGGVRSPLAADGDSADLAAALAPDVVLLVADAGLGTINDCRLATAALSPLPVVVALNRFDATDDLHCRNLDWLRNECSMDVWAITARPSIEALLARLR